MPIQPGYRANFDTLERAMKSGDLALLECRDIKTGATVIAIVACSRDRGGVSFSPLAKMFDGNPFEELMPPHPDGGFVAPDGSIVP